ncbi:hypothetical protein NDR87_19465 [Nocardia sp. CDC159]|uniref:Uncharacterized protein n=1 Tax=Nocardia pulmonis TaxID=2951408 RepID=A0A9X2EDA0_9NOCA|nr:MULTISPECIES: hypothetical protein [Nocardia]MCM6776128.1 hypothetical protein [Nocardia pulmonis]MCM6788545.1 hypothetical protein [Nocardia sp. CDC159]
MRGGEASATGIDKILDSGGDGLRFFTEYLPRYREWAGANPVGHDVNSLTGHYDEQRGMDVEPLRAFATLLGGDVSGIVDYHVGVQQARFSELPVRWSDSGTANLAGARARAVSAQVGNDREALRTIARIVSTAADKLEEIVRTKADAVRTDLATKTVAGKSATQVDSVIAYARGRFGAGTDEDARAELVRQVLPEFTSGDAKAYCGRWLNTVFLPAIDHTVAAFVGLNDATHTAVGGLYDQLAGALESVNAVPYISPDGSPSATTEIGAVTTRNAVDALFGGQRFTDGSEPADTAPASVSPASAQVPNSADALLGSAGLSDTEMANASGSNTGGADTGSSILGGEVPAVPTETSPANPSLTSISDMGQAGVWRPGDIVNVINAVSQITADVPDILEHLGDPIEAVGEAANDFGNAAKGFGEFFEDVIGPDGITGLVREGVEAIEKIDRIIDNHSGDAAAVTPPEAQTRTADGQSPSAPTANGATAPATMEAGQL